MVTKHVVLVPGFGGFDALGAIDYYEGVVEPLVSACPAVRVHFFPNLPTAAVATRGHALAVWLAKRFHRRSIRAGEEICFVGHSTGGLDIRQCLYDLLVSPSSLVARGLPVKASDLLSCVRSIQCLSTPHRGTSLALWFRWSPWLPQAVACVLHEALRCGRRLGASLMGSVFGQIFRASRTPDWIDAAMNTLMEFGEAGTPYERAMALQAFYDTLGWLAHMATDGNVILDLCPTCWCLGASTRTPARWPARCSDLEAAFILKQGVNVRSYVTRASRRSGCGIDLFDGLHAMTGACPPPSLGPGATITNLLSGTTTDVVPADNDGVVNCPSMIWPSPADSVFVEADHGDIIGHYERMQNDVAYDLLRSNAAFGPNEFQRTWLEVGKFACR